MSFLRSLRSKFQINFHLVFCSFFGFDEISKNDLGNFEKSWGNFFNHYFFEIGFFHCRKYTIVCFVLKTLITFGLKLNFWRT